MPPPVEFHALMQEVGQFLGVMAQEHQSLPPGKERDLLGELLAHAKISHQAALDHVPEQLTAVKQQLEETVAKAGTLKAEAEARLAEVEAMAAKPPVPPKPPATPAAPPPIDPALGAKLRDELLAAFFPGTKPAPPPRTGKDIWQDWEDRS